MGRMTGPCWMLGITAPTLCEKRSYFCLYVPKSFHLVKVAAWANLLTYQPFSYCSSTVVTIVFEMFLRNLIAVLSILTICASAASTPARCKCSFRWCPTIKLLTSAQRRHSIFRTPHQQHQHQHQPHHPVQHLSLEDVVLWYKTQSAKTGGR